MMHNSPQESSFDRAIINATLQLAQQHGWQRTSLIEASREAGLSLALVRQRFPFKAMVLLRLNRQIDEAALCGESYGTTVRDRLFDLLMRRFDAMQDYREGLCAVMHALPRDPALAAFLAATTMESLRWVAEAAGLECRNLGGIIRHNALLAIWSRAIISWEKDSTPDLATTMQTLDLALTRAERLGLLKDTHPTRPSDSLAEGESSLPNHIVPKDENEIL